VLVQASHAVSASCQKALEMQLDLAALHVAEASLKEQVHSLDVQLSQSVLDTLERERHTHTHLEQIERRVPTTSEVSAMKQRGGKGGTTGGEDNAGVSSEGDSDNLHAMEQMLLQRVNALGQAVRSEAQKQAETLQGTIDANKMKSDGDTEILKNDLLEQVCLHSEAKYLSYLNLNVNNLYRQSACCRQIPVDTTAG